MESGILWESAGRYMTTLPPREDVSESRESHMGENEGEFEQEESDVRERIRAEQTAKSLIFIYIISFRRSGFDFFLHYYILYPAHADITRLWSARKITKELQKRDIYCKVEANVIKYRQFLQKQNLPLVMKCGSVGNIKRCLILHDYYKNGKYLEKIQGLM